MLSDLGHWLLLTDAGLIVGSILIWAGLLTLLGFAVWRYGDVRMTDPEPIHRPAYALPAAPTKVGAHTYVWQAEPNYAPFQEFIEAVDEMAAATIDIADTVEIRPAHPLDVTAELERIDPSVPLFYSIKRPTPFRLETFTQGWTTEQVQRAIAAGRPE